MSATRRSRARGLRPRDDRGLPIAPDDERRIEARSARPAPHPRDPPPGPARPGAALRGVRLRLARDTDARRAGHAVHRGARRHGQGARLGAGHGVGAGPRPTACSASTTGRRPSSRGTGRRCRVRRLRGLRIGRTGAVLEALVPAILEQKVLGDEARRAWVGLGRRYGEDAPGPPGMRLPPTADVLAGLPYYAYHPFGVERRRADLIRAVARERRGSRGSPTPRPARRAIRRRPTRGCGRSPGSDRGRRPRSGSVRSATPTRSASATSTCRTSSPGRSPASRAGRTSGCWSCSSRIAASAGGCCGCSSSRAGGGRRAPRLSPQRIDRF